MLRSIGPGLAATFNVGAFDRRGHGRTADTAEPFTYEDMADETIAFVEHLDRRVHLVGHSDGANIALLVALRRPDLLKRIVVVGANYHYEGLVDFPLMSVQDPGFAPWALKYAAVAPDGHRTRAARAGEDEPDVSQRSHHDARGPARPLRCPRW